MDVPFEDGELDWDSLVLVVTQQATCWVVFTVVQVCKVAPLLARFGEVLLAHLPQQFNVSADALT